MPRHIAQAPASHPASHPASPANDPQAGHHQTPGAQALRSMLLQAATGASRRWYMQGFKRGLGWGLGAGLVCGTASALLAQWLVGAMVLAWGCPAC